MAEPKESSDSLTIRCPNCRQRFSVDGNFMNRMVECGACDHRFRINDEVIMRSKKFYPGERGGAQLNHFQRVPLSAAAPAGLQPMRYAEFNHPEQLQPVSPQRILAGICGVGLMILAGLLLIFGVDPGGVFSAMPIENKLIVAGFVSVLGIFLLVYANPKARVKAGFFGLVLGAGVISLPFFFAGQPTPGDSVADFMPETAEPMAAAAETDPLAELRKRFVTKPLEAEQERLEIAGNDQFAYGIYLTNLVPRNKYVARDFLIRETGAAPSSHPYPRDGGNYLMILTGVQLNIEEVAEIAGRLGKTEAIHPDIGVIVVKVDNKQFLEGSADKLNDSSDATFYELNRDELDNIDLDRVKRAVERLSEAEPQLFRADISRSLIGLLGKPAVNFHDEIAKALLVWAENPGDASEVGLEVLRRLSESGAPVSEALVELVTAGKPDDAIATLNQLWVRNPGLWENYYKRFGPAITPGLLAQFGSEDVVLRRSAIRLLGEVGTVEVLPELEKLSGDEDPEVRVITDRAIAEIKGR